MRHRELTANEAAILRTIRQWYGPQNSPDDVFFTDSDEAVIFVTAIDGTSRLIANLSNLGAWLADGTISSDEELRRRWLLLDE